MGNLKTVLEASGSSMENLLQVRIYVRGELNDCMAKVVPVLHAFLGDIRPALTGVGVASLASPELLVEIEAGNCPAQLSLSIWFRLSKTVLHPGLTLRKRTISARWIESLMLTVRANYWFWARVISLKQKTRLHNQPKIACQAI